MKPKRKRSESVSKGAALRALALSQDEVHKYRMRSESFLKMVENQKWKLARLNELLMDEATKRLKIRSCIRKCIDEVNAEMNITDAAYGHPFSALIEAIK